MTTSPVYKNISETLHFIKREITRPIDPQDGNVVRDKLNTLVTLLPNSSDTITQAKRLYAIALGKALAGDLKGMNATDKRLYIQATLYEEDYWVNEAEGVNKELHYAVEGCRTMLSMAKAEMQQLRY